MMGFRFVIAGMVILEMLIGPAMAQSASPKLAPMEVAPSGGCRNSGLGRVCPYQVPSELYMTEGQIKAIQRWNNKNVRQLNKQAPK
jgi:hypothetical protein